MLRALTARRCLRGIILSTVCLSALMLWPSRTPQPVSSHPGSAPYAIALRPDQMIFSGDVTSRANCADPAVCAWLDGTPDGSIMLGVDPASPFTDDWDGGAATAEVFLPNLYAQTLVVLKLSWPDRDGKGLHSPEPDRFGAITLDGQRLWDKRTTRQSTFGDYYAAEHAPILTTLVLTQSITHTLTLSVSAGTAWDLSEIALTAAPYPTATRGIGYSPFHDCQYPGGEHLPTTADLRADLLRLFHTTNAIRTYSATSVNGKIPALANGLGLPIYAGAWIDYPKTTLAQDDAEVKALIDLACTADLAGAIVGNEYYLRHRTAEALAYLQQRIEEVRVGIQSECGRDLPITTAEIDTLMFGWRGDPPVVVTGTLPTYRPIIDAVDFVMVHTYPFWGGMQIEGAAAFTVDRYTAMQTLLAQLYPPEGKALIIGEAGWPSGGAANGRAVPSERNQQRYMLELLPLADQADADLLYFDAFDELWKIEEPGGVGQHWGYSYTDRAAKYSYHGVLIPAEQLPAPPAPLTHTLYLPHVGGGRAKARTFPVYTEWPEGPGHFVPSGWMGDVENIDISECDRCNPHSGEMATRVSFSPDGPLGWGSVYWQYPENNWGDLPQALDLSWANKLTFWARGAEGGERIRFFAGGIGTKDDPYPDSLQPPISTGFLELTERWQPYTLNLLGQDLSHVVGGFGWTTDRCANATDVTFYLDDIQYEHDPDLTAPPPPGPVFPVYTDAAAQDNHYFPTAWMGDGEVPGRVSLSECWPENPYSGRTSIRVAYTQEVVGWAGVYWVTPAGNWGDRPGGHDLTGADRLTFWARSETPGAQVTFVIGGIGYPTNWRGDADCARPAEPYPDSVCPAIKQTATLATTWTKVSIPLPQGRDLSRVVGGFGWVSEHPVTFYLDDVVYAFD